MKTLIAVLTVAIAAVLGAIGFAYSGIYDVGADSPHGGLTAWLLSTTSHASIERRAADVAVPDLDDPELLREGVSDFDAMCAGCHGAPGRKPGAVGAGLNPKPPDLARSAEHMTPAELFWVTKHGIRMTGMPAWGVTHDDQALWPVVAFMLRLPELDTEGYQSLLASAAGSGHHASGASGHHHGGQNDGHHQGDPDGGHHHEGPAGGHSHGGDGSMVEAVPGHGMAEPQSDHDMPPGEAPHSHGDEHAH